MSLYCQHCGASLLGARLVQGNEQEAAEPQEAESQERGKEGWLNTRWPLLAGLLLAVCLCGLGSFLLVQRLPDLADIGMRVATPADSHVAEASPSEAPRSTEAPAPPAVRPPTNIPSPVPKTATVPLPTTGIQNQQEGILEPIGVRFLKDPLGALHFVGEVQNHGALAAVEVEVGVALLDRDGVPLAAETAVIPARLIPAGDSSPFEVILRDPPRNWTSYELQVGGEEADPKWLERYASLEVIEETPDRPGFDDYRINGLVKNTGPADVRDVQVVATFYGNDGRVVAVASTQVGSEPLAAGKAAPFRIDVYAVPVPVVHYVLSAEGIRAD